MNEKVLALHGFRTRLNAPLLIGGTVLPISPSDVTKVTNLLGTDYYSYLTISSAAGYYEVVLVVAEAGSIILDRRAVVGEAPQIHPNGSCVEFEVTQPFLVDLICQTNCCEPDPECPCVPLTFYAPTSITVAVGDLVNFSIVADGDAPMNISAEAPDWLTLDSTMRSMNFSGQAFEVGDYIINYAGTNCNGASIKTGIITLTVTD